MIYLRIKNIAVQIANLIFGLNKKNICKGTYYSWEEALKNCTSYKADEILEKTLKATLAVKNGEATYERDSVLFDKIEYSWPLTAGILLAASKSSGNFNILDFGGSLGTTYFQNRKFIGQLSDVSWHIIEQPHYVELAKKFIESSDLKFYENITELDQNIKIDVVLLPSVLSYLENPYEILDSLLKLNPPVLIIDRTCFNRKPDENDVIRIQNVPSDIYIASYPCRFFNERKLVSFIESNGYMTLEKFSSNEQFDSRANLNGFIFTKKNQ